MHIVHVVRQYGIMYRRFYNNWVVFFMYVRKMLNSLIAVCLVCSFTGCTTQTDSVDSVMLDVNSAVSDSVDAVMDGLNSAVVDIKLQLENDTKLNEIRAQVSDFLDTVKFDELKDAVTTEKIYEDTQTAQFVESVLIKPFQCEYVRMSGNVVGSSDFAYHKGKIVKTEKGYYIEEIQVSQNFEGVSDIVDKNIWIAQANSTANGMLWSCETLKTTSETATESGMYITNLLGYLPQADFYKENKVANVVNVSDCDIDVFGVFDSKYAYFYNSDGILNSIVDIGTQDVITFSDFKTENLMDVSEYFNN